MEQFSLDKWLQDKSRKICTRDGRPVRIICLDAKSSQPIVVLVSTRSISQRQFDELTVSYFNDGTYYGGAQDDFLDLFFADEELAEFEKAVQSICKNLRDGIDDIGDIHVLSNNLLDLARKEILKDLPKWKKATKHEDLEKHIAILEDGKVLLSNYLEEGDYYIDLEDLKTLPKEE